MRKILSLLALIGLMAFGAAGSAVAFSDHILLNQQLNGNGTFSWQHALPGDFTQFDDTITSATLNINAEVDGVDVLFAEGSLVGALLGPLVWDFSSGQLTDNGFDIRNIFGSVSVGDTLDISIMAFGPSLTLTDSTFTLEFTEGQQGGGDNGTAPIPEPATLLLLGSGLSGLALWGKRRKIA